MRTLPIIINKERCASLGIDAGDKSAIIDYLNKETAKGTLMEHLSIQVSDITEEYIEATMPVDERSSQAMQSLHGGASIALGETLGGYGSYLILPQDYHPVGLQIGGNHVAMAKQGDTIRAVGQLIHHGRTTHLWQIDLYSQDTGKLISTIKLTNSILSSR